MPLSTCRTDSNSNVSAQQGKPYCITQSLTRARISLISSTVGGVRGSPVSAPCSPLGGL